MATVILAEKPDQAKKFASALAKESLKNGGGFYQFNSEIFGDTIVTWAIGHLVGLALPEKYPDLVDIEKWTLDSLPFTPSISNLKYEVAKGKSKQFSTVKKYLENADRIIIATDPDREGENIAYNIFKLCKKEIFSKPMDRLWINSLEKKEIIKGFKNLRNAKETFSFFEEANSRQIADFLVGINYTRLFTLKLQEKGVKGVTSVGRVQTSANTLVVENDLEIANFKAKKYKVIECVSLNKEIKVIFRNSHEYFDNDSFIENTKKFGLDSASKGTVKAIEKEIKKIEPKKLFSLGGIQEYANKKWKYPSKKTDSTIQKLYDNGFLSYPRTDSELITTNEFEYLKRHLDTYKELMGIDINTPCLDENKRFVDGEKVLEHYALIPTEEIPDISIFSVEEKNIYEAITKRACLMFAEPYTYESTKVTLNVNGLEFFTTGNVPISMGWKSTDSVSDDEGRLPSFEENEEVEIKILNIEKETKAPLRLTEGKLLGKNGVMAKLGLGTQATRSGIIETLILREYVKIDDTQVFPTPKGYLLWDLTKNKDLLIGKPESTSQWEKYLKKIGNKQSSKDVFMNNIYKYVNLTISNLKEIEFSSNFLEETVNQNIHKIGNYLVEEKSKVFEVKTLESDSSFIIFKNISGKNINLKIIEDLLLNGSTSNFLSGFKSKKGSPFKAKLKLIDNKIEMEFESKISSNEPEKTKGFRVTDKGKVFEVHEESTGDQFVVFKNNSGKLLSMNIIKELLEHGKTQNKITGFKSKEGKPYSAYLVFDKEEKRIKKEFN